MKEFKKIKDSKSYYACSDGFVYKKSKSGYKKLKSNKWVNFEGKTRAVKNLIANCFVENPDKHKHVILLDNNHWNTKPENLKWAKIRGRETYIDFKTDKLLLTKIGVWIAQCHVKKNPYYKKYNSKGITVCKEWRDDTKNFLKWSKNTYFKGAYLIRIDKTKGYNPDNCFWGVREDINKLNCEMVYDIKEKLEHLKPSQIARKYSVSGERVRQIKRGKTLKNCE